MDLIRLKALLNHQQNILSQIALGESTKDIFDNICLAIEDIMEDKTAKCSIVCLSGDQLFNCSAPTMDPNYSELTNGVKIGEGIGSCGTAAYRKSRVIVSNIETSPLWKDFKDIALKFNLRSCWSTPIISSKSEVLGTFAIYHENTCDPSDSDIELIDYFVDFSRIALQKKYDTLKLNSVMKELESSTNKFNALTKVIPDSAFILSQDGDYVDVYSSSEELLSQSISSLMNKNLNDILPEQDAIPIMEVIHNTLEQDDVQVFEYELKVQKGNVFFEGKVAPIIYDHIEGNTKRHVLWIARDITARKQAEQEIEKLAYYDHLTNLPNRRLLNERLSLCVERINRSKKTAALLFLDIDDFKKINDTYGHSAGDNVLVELAERLNSVVRSSDTIARIGGDEFVVLLEYVGEDNALASSEATIVAEKLQKVFEHDFDLGEAQCKVGGSLGIYLIDDTNLSDNTNLSVDSILKFADSAMYQAKTSGGNRYSFYDI